MNSTAVKPLDPRVDQTLEALLAPGGRARLSPLVESAQLHLLTGQWPDDRRRYDSTAAILRQHPALLATLAETWNSTRREFAPHNYDTPAYMQMYALYYFSVNVSKLQLLLLELARQGRLCGQIWAVDIGVGAGSTALALLDFLYAWGLACELHHQPLPVTGLALVGVDKSSLALETAGRMVAAYREAVQRRIAWLAVAETGAAGAPALPARIAAWSQNFTGLRLDLEHQALDLRSLRSLAPQPLAGGPGSSLVVVSNVLNELAPPARGQLETFLNSLRDGSLAILIEPGDQEKTTGLMKWRAGFLGRAPAFRSLGPCGHELPLAPGEACASCWAARRESFHQPPLYLAFRSACEKISGDKRTFDDYENNLLSWSYALLLKAAGPNLAGPNLALKAGGSLAGPLRMRVLGKFHQKTGQKKYQLLDYPVDKDPYRREQRSWKEYYKICSLTFSGARFVALERDQGFQLPRLGFGQEISATNLEVDLFENKPDCYRLIPQEDGQTRIDPGEHRNGGLSVSLSRYDEPVRQTVDELAYRLFGFQALRGFQHDILSRVLCGQSVLGIAATGGGKSECFILPAMILPGITVVISPLRSLMTDQYDQRISQRYGLGDLATYINGDVPFQERQARLKRMELGYYKLVYFTPEQLERGHILDSLRRANAAAGIRYLAMDEAHCISQWGHDFRPSYLNIVRRLREYGIRPTIIALTATASPHVRRDVCEELGLNPLPVDQGGDVFVYSSNRPEINLEVRVKHSTGEKVQDILDELHRFQQSNQHNQRPGAALVFMPHTGGSPENTWRYFTSDPESRLGSHSAGVTGFAAFLERRLRQRVAIYHGKMESELEEPDESTGDNPAQAKPLGDLSGRTRVDEQTRFIDSLTSGVDIMVATKGFGMGIDKPNIRLVIHRSPTTNMEAYAQEAGRAGRDGEMASAILYYSPDESFDLDDRPHKNGKPAYLQKIKSDYQIQENFLNERYIRREDVRVMRAFLQQVQHRLPVRGENGLPDRTYLYFTCDEAIAFFNQCKENPAAAGLSSPYCWPDFPEREANEQKESGEHQWILARGHTYSQRTRYVNRILAALFRIRPTLGGQPNQAFLENVQESGARVHLPERGFPMNWPQIVHSNAYFGEILRKNRVSETEFLAALGADDLLGFARRVNLTLKEVVSLLNDIRLAEGRFAYGKWKGDLLDFNFIAAPLYGPARGKDSLQAWRDYAGAERRSSSPRENARRNNHPQPTLDDYFSSLQPHVKFSHWREIEIWTPALAVGGPAGQALARQLVAAVIPVVATAKDRYQAIPALQSRVIEFILRDEKIRQFFFEHWMPLYENSPALLQGLLKDLGSSTPEAGEVANRVLQIILARRRIEALLGLPEDLPQPRWRNAVSLVKRIKMFEAFRASNPGDFNRRVTFKHLAFLRDLFDWRKDFEEADMLAVTLLVLQEELPDTYLTPLQMLVEVLVTSGRADLAGEVARQYPKLYIRAEGKELPANAYIARTTVPQRTQTIQADYARIAKWMLAEQ